MSAERDALREALAPYIYEAYRLGKYGAQEYLPMWHEKSAAEHSVPWLEVDGAVSAVLAAAKAGDARVYWLGGRPLCAKRYAEAASNLIAQGVCLHAEGCVHQARPIPLGEPDA